MLHLLSAHTPLELGVQSPVHLPSPARLSHCLSVPQLGIPWWPSLLSLPASVPPFHHHVGPTGLEEDKLTGEVCTSKWDCQWYVTEARLRSAVLGHSSKCHSHLPPGDSKRRRPSWTSWGAGRCHRQAELRSPTEAVCVWTAASAPTCKSLLPFLAQPAPTEAKPVPLQ